MIEKAGEILKIRQRLIEIERKQGVGGLTLAAYAKLSSEYCKLQVNFYDYRRQMTAGSTESIIHISVCVFYKFEGVTFEYDRRKPFGPWPTRKDFEPKKVASKAFYDLFDRFMQLEIDEQEKYRV